MLRLNFHRMRQLLPLIAYFTTVNIIICSFYGLNYLSHGFDNYTPLSLFFGVISWLSQVGLMGLLVGSILIIVAIVSNSSRAAQLIIGPFLFNLLNIYLYVDSRIYGMYRFHINGLVISLMESPLGRKTFKLHDQEYWTFLLLVILLQSLLTLIFFKLLFQSSISHSEQRVTFFKRNIRLSLHHLQRGLINRSALHILAACTLLSHSIYATCDALNMTQVTFIGQAIPLYKPLTIKKFLTRHFNYKTPQIAHLKLGSSGTLSYPLPSTESASKNSGDSSDREHQGFAKPNFIMIVLDSWRFDAMNEQASPHIWQHAKNNLEFQNHFSGGNNTRSGMFTLFYGIHGFYWQKFLQERRPPFMLDTLKEQGYKIKPFGSVSLAFPEFYQTIFANVTEGIEDQFSGKTQYERDRQMTDSLLAFLQNRDPKQSFFTSLLYDSTHSPYETPIEGRKFQPSNREIYYAERHDLDGLLQVRNRYLNAVNFVDGQVGRILNHVGSDERLKHNTYIVITSDHGEEFYDHGFFGHISAFTPEQIHVPMILSGPNIRPGVNDALSSHYDIAPTIVNLLQPSVASESYSFGHSLLSHSKRDHVVSCAWENCAIYDQSQWLIFGVEDYNMRKIELRNKDYQLLDLSFDEDTTIYTRLAKILDEGSQFLH